MFKHLQNLSHAPGSLISGLFPCPCLGLANSDNTGFFRYAFCSYVLRASKFSVLKYYPFWFKLLSALFNFAVSRFCGANEAERHLGITLFPLRMPVRTALVAELLFPSAVLSNL